MVSVGFYTSLDALHGFAELMQNQSLVSVDACGLTPKPSGGGSSLNMESDAIGAGI